MSTDCRPLEPIPFSHLFDGRLGTRGISESASESASDGVKRLTDGSNYLWAYCEEGADSVAVFVRYASCGNPENIISAIEDEFDCRIVSEYQPEYLGQSLLTDLHHDDSRYDLCIGFKPDGSPGEIFITGSKSGSHMDGLLSDIGVLLSRLLQHGDGVEELAAGMGRLGGECAAASIIGSVLDRVASELCENTKHRPAKEGG